MSNRDRRGTAVTQNAADPRQRKFAERLEANREKRWLDSMAAVMGHAEGRAFVWSFLRKCRVFESVFDPHGSIQSYKIGRQDVGHELMAEVLRLGPAPYLQMEKEGRAAEASEQTAIDASHTPNSDATQDERDEA